MAANSFSSLCLSQEMLQNLDELGFVQMTPVQAESLPYIRKGRDVLAQAKTGSGKTAAFGPQYGSLLHGTHVVAGTPGSETFG